MTPSLLSLLCGQTRSAMWILQSESPWSSSACSPRHTDIWDRKPFVRCLNTRTEGFLGQNGVVRNQFARFSQIDEVSNADLEELIDLLTCFDRVLVSRVFAGEKFTRDDPIGVQVGSRGEFEWAYLDRISHRRQCHC